MEQMVRKPPVVDHSDGLLVYAEAAAMPAPLAAAAHSDTPEE